jgi:outer membrane protein
MSPGVTTSRKRTCPPDAIAKHLSLLRKTPKYFLTAGFLLASAHPLPAETLHDALLRAYQANPTLNAQRQSLLAINENLHRAESGYRPRVNATADAGYYTESDKYPPSANLSPTALQNPTNNSYAVSTLPHGVGVSVNQTLFDGFRTANTVLQAQSQISGARAATLTVEQNTLFLAVSAYVDVLADQTILNRIQRTISDLKEQMRQTQERHCFGDVTKTDVAQVETRLAATSAQLNVAEANLRTSIANFRQVVGIEPQKLIAPRAIEELLPPNLDLVVKIALAENPTIIAAIYGVRTAQLDVDIIHGERLPTISLTGLLNHRHDVTIPGDEQLNGSIVGKISIPLYEGGEVVARERQAKHVTDQRALETDAVRDQVRATAGTTWAVFVAAKERVTNARRQLTAARTAVTGIREQWALGDRTMREVLDAEQEYLTAEVNLAVAERDRIAASFALAQVMGRLTLAAVGTLNLNSGNDQAFQLVPTAVKFPQPAKNANPNSEGGGTEPNGPGCEHKSVGAWPLRLNQLTAR